MVGGSIYIQEKEKKEKAKLAELEQQESVIPPTSESK